VGHLVGRLVMVSSLLNVCGLATCQSKGETMEYFTTIRKRRRGKSTEYTARLIYKDSVTGQKKEQARNAKSPKEAKRKLKALEDDFLMGGAVAVESDRMSFSALVKHCKENRYCQAEYDDDGRKLFGVRGLATVLGHLKVLDKFFGKMLVREINVASLRAYRKSRLLTKTKAGTRLSVCTVNREMSTLRAMLNEAIVNDWLMINPFKRVRPGELISIADERKRTTVMSFAEEARLLEVCNTPYRRHLNAFVIAALDTGARRGELLSLRWSDVDFDNGQIGRLDSALLFVERTGLNSYKGKTVSYRPVPLTPRLAEALLDLQKKPGIATFKRGRKTREKPSKDLVFGVGKTIQNVWDRARLEANLTHVRLHDLRHTAATRLKEKLVITDVGLILGHSDPRTTQRYVNRTPEVVRAAGQLLHDLQVQNSQEFDSSIEETGAVN
jgi:integrase